jgi:hypothetical protein
VKIEQIKEIANAVLYEGYLLYPYRQSAIKNRQRWTFGVVYPREYSEANGSIEPWSMQTECLIRGSADTLLDVHVRFLHLLVRTASTPAQTGMDAANDREWGLAARMANEPLEEGVEREVSTPGLTLAKLAAHPEVVELAFPARRLEEDAAGEASATLVREQQALAGGITIAAEQLSTDLFKVSVRIENTTPGTGSIPNQGNRIMLQSFVSTHTILQVQQGAFISLMDTPGDLQEVAKECKNDGTWPVLVGNEGEYDAILSSPIILYDYPQIAPESPGPLFDGTEIDEILTLRIMTLTDEEKEQMRSDERTREILERTESLTPEQFMKLHGVIRDLRPLREGGEI